MSRSRRPLNNRRPVYEVTSGYRPARGAQLRPRRAGSNTWAWGCMFLGGLICVGMCAFTLLLVPIAFKQLPLDLQQRIAARIPLMEPFLPTRDPAVEKLPTLDPARATAAAALFDTPQPGVVANASATPLLGAVPPPLVGPTLVPSATALPRPTATAEPLPVTFHVENARPEAQTWNNCGPANLVQALRLLGVEQSQQAAAGWLKPNRNDANVSPWQLATYTDQFTGMHAVLRYNGDLELLKRLTYAGVGVIIETGLIHPDDGSWLGHYLTVVGWDNQSGYLYGLDTFESNGRDGKGVHEQFADLDERWKHFNRVYLVVYRPDDEWKVRDILGTAWDETQNAQEALAKAQQEAQLNPNDIFAWFNVGSSYVLLQQWQAAATAYDRARSTGNGLPWRMLWYQFGPYKAYYKVGDYKTVIELANAVIAQTRYVEESFYYRGLAYAASGVTDQAMADLQYAASFNPNFNPALTAIAQLQTGVKPVPETL